MSGDHWQKDHSIELILMDIMMPVMDGYEAMRLIRKNTHYAEVPIIASYRQSYETGQGHLLASWCLRLY